MPPVMWSTGVLWFFRSPGKPAREVNKVPMPFLGMPGWVRTWDEAAGAKDAIIFWLDDDDDAGGGDDGYVLAVVVRDVHRLWRLGD